MNDADSWVGVDIGGTKIAAGVVTAAGVVVDRVQIRTPSRLGAAAVVETALQAIVELRARAGPSVKAVGVGAAGVIDPESGRVVSATDHIVGWADTDLETAFSRAVGLPCAVLNDVHAHAVGEAWRGAAAGHLSALVVTVGTGIGSGLVLGGEVVRGAGGYAGHLGHVPCLDAEGRTCGCGRSGHLEAIASGTAILTAYRDSGEPVTCRDARDVVRLAATGSPSGEVARWVVSRAARALGRGLAGAVNLLDPEVVVIGGGLAAAGEVWWSEVRAAMASEVLRPWDPALVALAALGADAGIVGAARQAALGQKTMRS